MWRLNLNKHTYFILLIILLTLPSLFSLLNPGFFSSDDGEWMIIRFSAFHQALRDGHFPVRWLGRLNYDYGYPVANFLYPGFMYLAEVPKLLGFNYINSVKCILAISLIGSGVFSFLWLSRIFSLIPSIFGAITYVYFPYHLYDVYKRGSVGESLAIAVIAYLLWMTEKKNSIGLSIGIALLILSHNTLALLYLPLLIFYSYIRYKKYFLKFLVSLGLGMLIAAFFWIPALLELRYTVFKNTQVSDWSSYFNNYHLIGFIAVIILCAECVILFLKRYTKESKSATQLSLFFLFISIVSIFFSLSVSSLVWNYLPISFIQFPFRFLSLAVVSISFLVSYTYSVSEVKYRKILGGLLCILLLVAYFIYAKPESFFYKDNILYATNEATTTVKNEYMPQWVKEIPSQRPIRKIEVIEGKGDVNILFKSTKKILFMANGSDKKIRVNIIYYPGWFAYLNNKEIPINYENNKGVIELLVPGGKHTIEVVFKETLERLIADFLSLTGVIVIIFQASVIFLKKKYEVQ